MATAYLESIWIAPSAGEPMFQLEQVEVEKGLGILGDRYHRGEGTFSRWQRPNRAISIIESESITVVKEESCIDLSAGLSRRNLVTVGIHLPDLIGRNFQIGTALFRASGTCAPCKYLERLLGPGTFEALRNRGGIRVEVIESGTIKPGDSILPVGKKNWLP